MAETSLPKPTSGTNILPRFQSLRCTPACGKRLTQTLPPKFVLFFSTFRFFCCLSCSKWDQPHFFKNQSVWNQEKRCPASLLCSHGSSLIIHDACKRAVVRTSDLSVPYFSAWAALLCISVRFNRACCSERLGQVRERLALLVLGVLLSVHEARVRACVHVNIGYRYSRCAFRRNDQNISSRGGQFLRRRGYRSHCVHSVRSGCP